MWKKDRRWDQEQRREADSHLTRRLHRVRSGVSAPQKLPEGGEANARCVSQLLIHGLLLFQLFI